MFVFKIHELCCAFVLFKFGSLRLETLQNKLPLTKIKSLLLKMELLDIPQCNMMLTFNSFTPAPTFHFIQPFEYLLKRVEDTK